MLDYVCTGRLMHAGGEVAVLSRVRLARVFLAVAPTRKELRVNFAVAPLGVWALWCPQGRSRTSVSLWPYGLME